MATGDELLGKSLGGYAIESRLGSGATGVVYRARHPRHDEPLALKVLHDNLGSITGLQRRFEREARVLKKLDHPHIVEITDFGVEGRYTYIAMEMLVGRTLEEFLQERPMFPERVLEIFDPVLEALAYAHDRDIVHRDLKPANVFLIDDGTVKLLDFGLAKMLSIDSDEPEEGTLTRKGRIVGTPAYMAPEQITGVFLDVRADVYAMGVMLYELLADRRPFLYDRRSELLRAHLLEPVPAIMKVRRGLWVCDELQALLERALTKDPADRYPNARALLNALRALPEEAVSLDGTAARMAQRRRTGAASAIISEGERQAVTESAGLSHEVAMQPPPAASPKVLDLTTTTTTDPHDGAIARPLPAGFQPGPLPPPARTPGEVAPRPAPGGIPTPALFLLALALLGLAALLWVTLMMPGGVG